MTKYTEMTRQKRNPGEGALLTRTRSLLRRAGLRARKELGQHFLIDEKALESIVTAAQLTPADTVIEIGPGLGVLTAELAGRAGHVLAIELDDRLATLLGQTLSSFHNITVINEDVLEIDPAALLREHSRPEENGHLNYKVVANLPYYITSPVLRHFLEASVKPQLMVVMVQKEVAEQIAAQPGKMSLLSVSVQLYGEAEIVGYVPASSFYPVPEVASAVLKVTLYSSPAAGVTDTEGFFSLVRAGFTAGRKQLANSLSRGLRVSKSETLRLLAESDIDPQRRAETLTLEEWARLWRVSTRREC